MADRVVTVKLTADVEDYVAAMKRARKATDLSRRAKFAERLSFTLIGAAVGWFACGLMVIVGGA